MVKISEKERALSFETYLAWEAQSTQRHEFVRGEIFAMPGVTLRHDRIATNILLRLNAATRGTPCNAYSSDVKVRPIDDIAYYPDASVDCESHLGSDLLIERPSLVVEVTSRSTVRTDRGEKREHYCACPSLQTYLIVDHSRRAVTCHRRISSERWTVEQINQDGSIGIAYPAISLTLEEIYDGVEMPPLSVAERDMDELAGAYVAEI